MFFSSQKLTANTYNAKLAGGIKAFFTVLLLCCFTALVLRRCNEFSL